MKIIHLGKKYNKLKKAMGLVEVLIALVLIATTMIMAIRVVAKGLKTTKENEIKDRAAGIMLRAFEFNQLEIPSDVFDPASLNTDPDHMTCFALDNVSPDDNFFRLMRETNENCPAGANVEITTCDPDSDYLVRYIEGVNICNQIIFTNYPISVYTGTPSLTDQYRITSVVVYELEEGFFQEKINTFKTIN